MVDFSVGCGLAALDNAAQAMGTSVGSADVFRLLSSFTRGEIAAAMRTRILALPLYFNEACSQFFFINLRGFKRIGVPGADMAQPPGATTDVACVLVLNPLHSEHTVMRLAELYLYGIFFAANLGLKRARPVRGSYVPFDDLCVDRNRAPSAMMVLSRDVMARCLRSGDQPLERGQFVQVNAGICCISNPFCFVR